ncbi:crossover junction endonuclease MUS81-like isoform X2 [Anneissia japonica]|uniref:crossover junction endonuclease MUS81-like isoform X2 n=1 Tax=Anneissia japonica TaxID=1529436 RepID=UPI00142592DD|nr:crossover junction endonuclease MUS81-like isoform X2 [Anneissia japonica]
MLASCTLYNFIMNLSVKELFIQWLTEWKDEAQAQSWKSQYTYGKALRSLKKYPLPVKCGQDVKILEFFGDKLCKMLDKKLTTYKEENGMRIDISESDDEADAPVPPKKKRTKAKPTATAPAAPREYVPAYRSGPYALILTLYRDFQDASSKGFMKKPELQTKAQDLSEKSMTVADADCHYTAWSSMSTLITKGYVTREGNPSRYTITPAGCDLAHKLEVGHDQAKTLTREGPSPRLPVDPLKAPLPSLTTLQAPHKNKMIVPEPRPVADALPHGTEEPDSFQYTYVDDQGREICSKDSAVVIIDDNIGVGFLVKCIKSDLAKFNIQHLPDPRKAAPGMEYVYIDNNQALDICPGIKKKPKVNKRPPTDNTKTSIQAKKPKKTKDHEVGQYTSIAGTKHLSSNIDAHAYAPATTSKHISNHTYKQNFATDLAGVSTSSRADLTTNKLGSDQTVHGVSNSNRSDLNSNNLGADWHGTINKDNAFKSTSKPEFILHPGTFEIILCVDNCEIGGASKRKKQLLEGLHKNHVVLDVRKLQVGDFLWVAREKQSGIVAQATDREAVLDYIVERKRMDDLCGSIKDGRFKEQKFRLKQCGINNPVYLVEEYGSMDNMSLPKATLQQAIVNTQIVDKFHVKHTCGIPDSVAYFTVMTRYLQSTYSNKCINVYTRENFENMKCVPSLNDKTQHLMSFFEFNENSIKNKVLTTGEVFAKQLLQFSGLTAEKAQAIVNIYPTVSHLLEAYSSCVSEKEAHKLLSTLKFGKTQRNLGPALSRLVYQVYNTSGPLT